MGATWISEDHLATPKWLACATILDLEMYLMAHRFALLQDMSTSPTMDINDAIFY